MSEQDFSVFIDVLVTHRGNILVVKENEDESWHLVRDGLKNRVQPEESAIDSVEELTGLKTEIHQVLDVNTVEDELHVFFHAESDDPSVDDSKLSDSKWVDPEDFMDEISDEEESLFSERRDLELFIEKMIKAPVF